MDPIIVKGPFDGCVLFDQDVKGVAAERVRNNNAYLLFYERIGGVETKPEPPTLDSVKEVPTSILSDMDPSLITSTLPAAPSLPFQEKVSFIQGEDSIIVGYDEEEGEMHDPSEEEEVDDEGNASSEINGDLKKVKPGKTASLMAFFDLSMSQSMNRRGRNRKGVEQPLPANVRRAIWEENITFFRDKHLFDPGMPSLSYNC